MSGLAKFFGGKKNEAKSPQEAMLELKGIQDLLTKKQTFLEKKIEDEITTAKKHGVKNKKAALQALTRKKKYEKQLQQMDGTLTTLEFQIDALENACTNTEVMKAMQTASKSLKAAHNDMDIDKVHDVMDEIQEQQEIAQEIAEAVSNPIGFGNNMDEDELLAELEALQEEELEKQLIDTGIDLPNVPLAQPTIAGATKTNTRSPTRTKEQQEEDQLAKLQAWAS